MPPALPGFYWDPEKNKYFKIVNGGINGTTSNYHNNTIQKKQRNSASATKPKSIGNNAINRAKMMAKWKLQNSHWSSISMSLLGRLQGMVPSQPSLMEVVSSGCYGISKTELPAPNRWVCHVGEVKVEVLEASRRGQLFQLIIDGKAIDNSRLLSYLASASGVEVFKSKPEVGGKWIWYSPRVVINGEENYFPRIFHGDIDCTYELLQSVSEIAKANPKLRSILSRIFGLDRTVLAVSGDVKSKINRINHLLAKHNGKLTPELNMLMRQFDIGSDYWYCPSIYRARTVRNIHVHICHRHVVVVCDEGGIVLPFSESSFVTNAANVWKGRHSHPVGICCSNNISVAYKGGIIEAINHNQVATRKYPFTISRLFNLRHDLLVTTTDRRLIHIEGANYIEIGEYCNDNDPHQQVALVDNLVVISQRSSFTVVDPTTGARAHGSAPITQLLRGVIAIDGSIGFSCEGEVVKIIV